MKISHSLETHNDEAQYAAQEYFCLLLSYPSVYGLFIESIMLVTNDEEINENMYPVIIFMLFHETNKSFFVFYK